MLMQLFIPDSFSVGTKARSGFPRPKQGVPSETHDAPQLGRSDSHEDRFGHGINPAEAEVHIQEDVPMATALHKNVMNLSVPPVLLQPQVPIPWEGEWSFCHSGLLSVKLFLVTQLPKLTFLPFRFACSFSS